MAAVLAVGVLASCGPAGGDGGAAAAVAPPARPSAPPLWSAGEVARLRARLAPALGMSALATSGIAILDANGRPLVLRRAATPLAPASTFKLLVAVAALATLGPEFRFETTVEAIDGPHGGTLAGSLYLIGGGDPSLTHDDLAGAAHALAAAGVERVAGGVVGDASAFGGPEVNPAWDRSDLQYDYAAGTSALSLDEGTVEFRVVPTAAGEPARIDVLPPNGEVAVHGGVVTGGAGELTIDRAPAENAFTFGGGIGGYEQRFLRPVVDQARYAAGALRAALVARDVDVAGGASSGTGPLSGVVLWRHASAPLRVLLRHMLVESDNHFAEQLLRTLGTRSASVGTEGSGGEAERDVLRRLGVPDDGLAIVDGSGLAPSDRVTPIALASLLARAAREPEGPVLLAALPRAGIEGTVRHRDLNAALGRTRAKSGHIEHVDALAGYVETHRHGRVAFAVLVNDPRADDGYVDEGIDRTLDILAEE